MLIQGQLSKLYMLLTFHRFALSIIAILHHLTYLDVWYMAKAIHPVHDQGHSEEVAKP